MKKCRFLLGFGSETGQSKSIAQGMVDIALEQHQINVEVFELDEIDKQVRLGQNKRSNKYSYCFLLSITV
jgi:hypothetical protein